MRNSFQIAYLLNTHLWQRTQSEKALRLLNDWIKENNYINNYTIRDSKGNRMEMDLDGLFEWWSEKKDMYYETRIAELENKLQNLPESNYKKYSDYIDILDKAIDIIKESHCEKNNKCVRNSINVIKEIIEEYMCLCQLESEKEVDEMRPLVCTIQYLRWERTASREDIAINSEMCRLYRKLVDGEPLTVDEKQYFKKYYDRKSQIEKQIASQIVNFKE